MYLEKEAYKKDLENAWNGIVDARGLCHKRILITGATGLIGSFMTDLLLYANKAKAADMEIYILARDGGRVRERFASSIGDGKLHEVLQDVTEPFGLPVPVDCIVHAAGDGFPSAFREHPVETMAPALLGTYRLLEYAREYKVEKFLFISSGEIYGDMGEAGRGFTEKDCGRLDTMDVRSCYPMAKRCGETLCASFGGQYHVPVVVARPSHVYGACTSPHDNRAAAQFLDKAARGQSIALYSQGKQVRSYTYVADCVSGLLTILLHGRDGEAYNVANPDSRATVAEFAKMLAGKAGVGCGIKEPSENEKKEHSPIGYAVLDASKLEGLGWHGQYDMDKGLENMLEIRKQVDGYGGR